jgi:hypothetical protein
VLTFPTIARTLYASSQMVPGLFVDVVYFPLRQRGDAMVLVAMCLGRADPPEPSL